MKADRHTLERDRASALAELEELSSRLGAPLLLRLRTEGPTAVASLEQLQQLQRLEALRDEAQHGVRVAMLTQISRCFVVGCLARDGARVMDAHSKVSVLMMFQ